MPFGWFGGDKKLEQQKAALQECTELLAYLEARVAHLAHLEAKLLDVWPKGQPRSRGIAREDRGRFASSSILPRTGLHPPSASSPISTTSST